MKTSERVQQIINSEEHVRRRWFWGLSFGFGVIMILIWAAYIQVALPKTKNALAVEQKTEITPQVESGEGFFSVLGRGFGEISKKAEDSWRVIGGKSSLYFSEIKNLVEKERNVDLKPETDLKFAPAVIEGIPPAELPNSTK
jgi:hypothetical protein